VGSLILACCRFDGHRDKFIQASLNELISVSIKPAAGQNERPHTGTLAAR